MSALLLAAIVAATPIKLDEVREQSRANVAALQAELDRLRSETQVTVARGAVLPHVSLSAGVSGSYVGPKNSFQPVIDPVTFQVTGFQPSFTKESWQGGYDLSVTINQVIYDARVWAQLAQAGANRDYYAAQESEQRMTSEFEGVRRFYNLYRAQKTLDVLNDRLRDDQTQVDRAHNLFEAGKGRKDDELAAQVNLNNDRITAIQQESTIAAARADLATWLARPGGEELVAADPGTLTPEMAAAPSFDSALALAHGHRPLYQALDAQVKSAQQGIAVSRAGYLPRVGANGYYDRGSPDARAFFADPARQNMVAGGVTLSWDIFSGLQTQAAVSDAELAARKAQLSLEQSQRELEGDLKKALEALRVAIASTQVALTNREVADAGLKLSEGRFAAGAGTTLEVRDAQLKLTSAELTLLSNRIDVEIAREYLNRAVGIRSGSTP